MRTDHRLLSRPTYSYQARRQRQIWPVPLPWSGRKGTYTAIAMLPDRSFEVLATAGGRARWIPVEIALSEPEVQEWLQRCRDLDSR